MFLIIKISYQIVEAKQECYVNDDCAIPDVCNKGSCINACRLSHCGSNAICEPGFHSAKCVCLPGYTGNPQNPLNNKHHHSNDSRGVPDFLRGMATNKKHYLI